MTPINLFQFTGTSNPAGALVWDFGDGTTGSGNNVSHHYTAPGSYTVTVTSTSASGCTGTKTLNNSITVLSNPVPVITASSLSGCTPFSVVLNAAAPGAVSLQWDLKNGLYFYTDFCCHIIQFCRYLSAFTYCKLSQRMQQ
ncbi:MAG: PKD domain-containing protein [Bacteroidia bacterium]